MALMLKLWRKRICIWNDRIRVWPQDHKEDAEEVDERIPSTELMEQDSDLLDCWTI